jgi:RNA recognition motif-containing protein
LSFNTTQDRLSEAFASAGQVVSVHIGTDRETGRSRGFAFVEFSSDEGAQNAIATPSQISTALTNRVDLAEVSASRSTSRKAAEEV